MNKPIIKVFDNELNFNGFIDDYEFISIRRRWQKAGDFKLVVNHNKEDSKRLEEGYYIMIGDNPHKAGYIDYIEYSLDKRGKVSEKCIVMGHTLGGLVGTRITDVTNMGVPQDSIISNVENVFKHYVYNHIVNPIIESRKVPYVDIAQTYNRGISIEWNSRMKNVMDEFEKISLLTGMGWGIYLDYEHKKLVFDILEGKDLSASNGELPPIIFSPDFDALESQSYKRNKLNYRNVGYVGGQGEGVDREFVIVGEADGINRREIYIDARDLENTSDLINRGQQKLAEYGEEVSLEGDILLKSPYEYEKDYNLGDIVTLSNSKWGVMVDYRIVEIYEAYDNAGVTLKATFGASNNNLLDLIKRELDTPIVEGTGGEGGGVSEEEMNTAIDTAVTELETRINNELTNIELELGNKADYTHNHNIDDINIDNKLVLNNMLVFDAPSSRHKVLREVKELRSTTSTWTGTIKISLPQIETRAAENTFVGMKVRLWEYSGRGSCYLYIDGYMQDTPTWSNTACYIDKMNNINKPNRIRFGLENGRHVILISKTDPPTNSSWRYLYIGIEQLLLGWVGADSEKHLDSNNYDISLITDETGINIITTYNL